MSLKQCWQHLREQWLGVMVITPSVAIALSVLSGFGLLQSMEWLILDQVMRLRPPEPVDDRITIVTIDESDLDLARQWPMSDQLMAQMIYNLTAQRPRAVGINLHRALPVAPGREVLTRAFEEHPNVIGIEQVFDEPIPPLPILTELGQVAASDLLVDRDGKVRRGWLWLGEQQSLGARLAEMYLAQEIGIPEVIFPKADTSTYQMGKTVIRPLSDGDRGYVSPQATLEGYQHLLNYRGGLESFNQLSFQDVIENQIPPGLIRDRLVLVGVVTPSLNETFPTPYSNQFFQPIDLMPGVAIHGALASQIISAVLDNRPLLQPIPQVVFYLLLGATAGLGAIATKQITVKKVSFWRSLLITTCGVVGLFALGFISLSLGLVMPIFTLCLAITAAVILTTNYESQKRLKIINHRLAIANKKLEDYSQDLEQEVGDRTKELSNTLKDLQVTQTSLIQAEKMAALGQMVAGIAHEINNPITYISGNVCHATEYVDDLLRVLDLFRSKYRDEEIDKALEEIDLTYLRYDFYKLLESISKGAVRVSTIVKSLRTFSHLDEAELKQVNLIKDIDSVLLMIQSRLADYDHRISVKIDHQSEELPLIQCYAAKINQVLLSILDNAIDAIEFQLSRNDSYCGEITIQTQLLVGKQVAIRIIDNGVGVTEELRTKIFDPFFTTKPVGKGTGLGLAIAHSIIVEQHHGSLNCRRNEAGDTEFSVILPITHHLYHGHLSKP